MGCLLKGSIIMGYLSVIKLAGFIVTLIIFSVRIERRLTRIEVNIEWIKGIISNIGCNDNSNRKG